MKRARRLDAKPQVEEDCVSIGIENLADAASIDKIRHAGLYHAHRHENGGRIDFALVCRKLVLLQKC